jgi:hypothetical protein
MLGTYFYHEIIRKTIIGFGTLFNNIYIKHLENDGDIVDETKVGLSYGPSQKFLAKIQQQADLSKSIAITLPRMSFEMTGLRYDSARKTTITQTFKACGKDGTTKIVYMPVPYDIDFELSIYAKLNDDALQIIEQILPFFQPSFNLTIDLIESIGEKKDIPIELNSIDFQDDYEGDFSVRRALIYTLRFTAKTYVFGPIADSTDNLIKKVQVDLYTNTNRKTAKREMRYITTPRAKKDYDNDNTGDLTETIAENDILIPVQSTTGFNVGDRVSIDQEIIYIKEIPSSTQLYVERGFESTTKATHLKDADLNLLTPADDALIVPGDDFGFNETWETFSDSKNYSPTQQIDI